MSKQFSRVLGAALACLILVVAFAGHIQAAIPPPGPQDASAGVQDEDPAFLVLEKGLRFVPVGGEGRISAQDAHREEEPLIDGKPPPIREQEHQRAHDEATGDIDDERAPRKQTAGEPLDQRAQ